MTTRKRQTYFLLTLLLCAMSLRAETLYVTDRILLGVHQLANEQSPVITSIASGTPTTVLTRNEEFVKIRTADGMEGWVIAKFLKKEKPAAAELEALNLKLQEELGNNKKLTTDLNRAERELQVGRDEVSNAKTTVKELQNTLQRQQSSGQTAEAAKDNAELIKANAEIKALQDKLALLEKASKEAAAKESAPSDTTKKWQTMDEENQAMRVRIEAALANLKGDKVPSNAELAAIRPKFPFWYWTIILFVLAIGAGAGIYFYDYYNRKRHGGFRL
jgi:SH3 domain protein